MKTAATEFGLLVLCLMTLLVSMPSDGLANTAAVQPAQAISCRALATVFDSACGSDLKLAAANELQGKICQASIQDQIEWDYEGRNHWAIVNLEKICKNAEYSLQPGTCFHRIMHGNINHGDGTRWHWSPALKLCAGTQNSSATIACFSKAISQQIHWRQAIEQCRVKP